MSSPRTIINQALKDLGVAQTGQLPQVEDIEDAFIKLNWMIAQWRRKSWLVYHKVDLSAVSTGAQSYTVGPGGAINVSSRPATVDAAYIRQIVPSQPQPVDFPCEIIKSMEDYARIPLKTLKSFAYALFYDPAWPIGLAYPWPLPQANIYEIHLICKAVLDRFRTLDQVVDLPEEYEPALSMNLALRLQDQYSEVLSPLYIGLAKDSLNVLREANTAIGTLSMPDGLMRPGIYDPYSDQTR